MRAIGFGLARALGLLLAFGVLFGCDGSSPTSPDGSSAPSGISGTTWVGTETCVLGSSSCLTGLPNPITYTYLEGGALRYTTVHGTWSTATWTQAGVTVTMEFNNHYNEATGTINGKVMTGTAQNVVGYRTTFQVTRQ